MKVILTPEQKEALKTKLISMGYKTARKVFGSEEKILELIFDGDVRRMLNELVKEPPSILTDEKLYIHRLMIPGWDLPKKNDYSYFLGRYLVNYHNKRLPMMVTVSTRPTLADYHRVDGTTSYFSGISAPIVGLGPSDFVSKNQLLKKERMSVLKRVMDEYDL